MNKQLKAYEKASNELKDAFLKELYPDHSEYYEDEYWIGNEIGGVLNWSDYFESIGNMADYFRYGYSAEQWFAYYDHVTEELEPKVNMKNFLKLK
jgi:hypothetical protein|tara:strand:- start:320 stop:604 length:285 start_codon:yes stop_codon:yes gene_type:complete